MTSCQRAGNRSVTGIQTPPIDKNLKSSEGACRDSMGLMGSLVHTDTVPHLCVESITTANNPHSSGRHYVKRRSFDVNSVNFYTPYDLLEHC
jgi:hypothetical protein